MIKKVFICLISLCVMVTSLSGCGKAKFDRMMQSVLDSYDSVVEKMEMLKQEGKTNTVTYKQLMAEKLKNQNIISLYKIYGLIDE